MRRVALRERQDHSECGSTKLGQGRMSDVQEEVGSIASEDV